MVSQDLRSYLNGLCLGIVFLGAVIAFALFLYIRNNEQQAQQHHLQLAYDEHFHAIAAEGDVLQKVLQGLMGLYDASDMVEEDEFARFSNNVALRHDYIKAVLWLPRETGNPAAFPVRYAVPAEYAELMSGLNIAADPQLGKQLHDITRDQKLLVQPDRRSRDNGTLQSIRVYAPVYYDDGLSLRGFVMLLLDFDEFIDAALARRTTSSRALDIAIINSARDDRLLFYHPTDPTLRSPDAAQYLVRDYDYRRPLTILDQDWSLLIRPVPGRLSSRMTMMPWFALFATLTITFLIAGVVGSNLTRRNYAEVLVAERTRELRKSEERLAQLYDIISSNLDFAAKTRRLLEYGCAQLGLQYAMLSRIENGNYTIQYACAKNDDLKEGLVYPLNETYCGQMLQDQTLTAITHAGETDWRDLQFYQHFKLESYIGTPLYTGGQLFGALSFSGAEPRSSEFTQAERELVQLMAQWLSMELVHIQFEDRLLEQRNTISHILESTAEAFVAVDREHRVLYANTLTHDLLKLEKPISIGERLEDTAPALLDLIGNALEDILNMEPSRQFDCYSPGSDKWLEVAIHPTLQGASISLRDITDQKHNAEILSHTLGLKNAILNSANFTIIATDENGTIMSFNRAAERMLGYSAEEMIGQHSPVVFHDVQEIAARARELSEELETPIQPGFEAFVALARRGIPDEQEWTYIRRDGGRLPVLLSITEMTNEEGKCIGFLGIGVDITERKRIEKIRDEFISTVSHELRTPLTSIRGSLGLLSGNLGKELPEQAHSLLEIAGRNTERLLHLINDILDINKIESGRMAFNYEPVPLGNFLQQSLENNLAYARQYNVELMLAADLPELELYADEHRLMQVMNNLLSNAVKFSRSGDSVEIDARVQQHFVRISVTDHGKGISDEFRSKVFQRFSQADASDSRRTGGTGLGLSIARAIVEQHGGHINFVSRPGIGTTFYFDLPIYRHQSITRIKDQIISLDTPRPHRLLICEDDSDIAGLLQLMLARQGYQSDICTTAGEALKTLEQHHYDALLLDILLPDLNGLDLIRQLRQSADWKQLPIIVVSAIANEARNQLEGGIANIVDWLNKPLDQERLLQSVEEALQHTSDRQPRVLYVEDEIDLHEIIGQMLQDRVRLTSARSLQQARDLLDRETFDLVLLDVKLPDGSGMELLETIKDLDPQPATVIFSNHEVEESATREVSAALLKSTTTRQTLLQTLSACLHQRARSSETATEKEQA